MLGMYELAELINLLLKKLKPCDSVTFHEINIRKPAIYQPLMNCDKMPRTSGNNKRNATAKYL